MSFTSLKLFLFATLLASIAQNAISIRHLTPSPFHFPKHLQGSRKGDTVEGIHNVKFYLQHFGYLTNISTHARNTFDDPLEYALRTFQKNYRLNATGILDVETLTLLSTPRCGHPNIVHPNYALVPGRPKWPPTKYHLTYAFIHNFPPNFEAPVRCSLDTWSGVSKFTFSETIEAASDVKISFERGDHGDGCPFYSPNYLAHAFYPTDGRLHLNMDTNWVWGSVDSASDVQTVSLHELGHILGLAHSLDEGAVMYAYIPHGVVKSVTQDDIAGITDLYGS
ncbi:metalloendoproteinase 3-MMP-like [Momordica charantia]|uniref:Metalloendoproteinase 3-MMP-like n=1 Tax=Momordica charantia TaxID=3673 RepID=A0A6J1BXR0_MOMCH|nr:metalloendoproteinase 3-MMP-like [Momordica charantia]